MSNGGSSALDNASNDANQNMGSSPAGSPSQSCGSAPASPTVVSPQKNSWIGIKLLDQDNKPVVGEPYVVKLPDGSTVEGELDKQGCARIDGIDPGNCSVSFPNRDAADWKHN